MQNDLWDCIKVTKFAIDREFMRMVAGALDEVTQIKTSFFQLMFDKIFIETSDVKYENLAQADFNLDILKILVNTDSFVAELFVNSPDFLDDSMNAS